jgi:hypothetical protein
VYALCCPALHSANNIFILNMDFNMFSKNKNKKLLCMNIHGCHTESAWSPHVWFL